MMVFVPYYKNSMLATMRGQPASVVFEDVATPSQSRQYRSMTTGDQGAS